MTIMKRISLEKERPDVLTKQANSCVGFGSALYVTTYS